MRDFGYTEIKSRQLIRPHFRPEEVEGFDETTATTRVDDAVDFPSPSLAPIPDSGSMELPGEMLVYTVQNNTNRNLWHLAGPTNNLNHLPINATKHNAVLVHTCESLSSL